MKYMFHFNNNRDDIEKKKMFFFGNSPNKGGGSLSKSNINQMLNKPKPIK